MVKINNTNLKFRGKLTPINKSRITKIVQHHMAHPSWHLNDVHTYHRYGNGWAGIGYNYWIDFKGNIYQGRGMNVGAHASGHNSTTLGIGYQGDFSTQTMPKAQLQAGVELNKWLMDQLPNKVDIVGHRDVGSTACPGKNFRMAELKSGVIGQTTKPTTSKPKPKSKGNARIRTIQSTLNSRYNTGLVVDGINGKLTKKAIIKGYQTELNTQFGAGLVVDGIWGKRTRNASVTVRRGAKGRITWLIQARLYCLKYDPKGLDSVFGGGLETAIRKFQKDKKIGVDGIVGKGTFSKLFG